MSDTPETDAAWSGDESGLIFDRKIKRLCMSLERQRDAYAETLRQTLVLLDRVPTVDQPTTLANIIRKRHPELAQEDTEKP